jgi:thiol:disulfide interchange protein
MSSQNKFCPFCGTEVEPSATFCGNCGAAIEQKPVQTPPPAQTQAYTHGTQPTYQPAPTKSVETEVEGIIGLVLSVLSCIGVLPLIGSIVGVILGHISRRKSKSPMGTIALVAGYLGIAVYIIVPVIVVVVLFATGYWWYY